MTSSAGDQGIDYDFFLRLLEHHDLSQRCRSLELRALLRRGAVRKDNQPRNETEQNLIYPPSLLKNILTEANVTTVLSCRCAVCLSVRRQGGSDALTDRVLVDAIVKGDGDDVKKNRQGFSALLLMGACFAVRLASTFRFSTFKTDTKLDLLKREVLTPLTNAVGSVYSDVDVLAVAFQQTYDAFMSVIDCPIIDLDNLSNNFTESNLPFLNEEAMDVRSAYGTLFTFEVHDEFKGKKWKEKLRGSHAREKLVRKELNAEQEANAERQTLQFVSQCGQPNLIELLFWYTRGNKVNYVFKFYPTTLEKILWSEGPDLKTSMPQNFNHSLLQHWLWQGMVDVVRAMDFFHIPKRGNFSGQLIAAHFDLKPANILVDWDGTLVITDFGLATIKKLAEDGRTTITARGPGTFSYSPPPQKVVQLRDSKFDLNITGDDRVAETKTTRAYDVWSLACIMTEVIDYILHSRFNHACFENFLAERRNDDPDSSQSAKFWRTKRREGYELKPSVENKLKLFRQYNDKYLTTVTNFIEKMFSINPLNRPSMAECLTVMCNSAASEDWPMVDEDETSILGLGTTFQLRHINKVSSKGWRCYMYMLYNSPLSRVRLVVEFDKDGSTFVISDKASFKTEYYHPHSLFREYDPDEPWGECSFSEMHPSLTFTFEERLNYIHFFTAMTRQKVVFPYPYSLNQARVPPQHQAQLLIGRFPFASCVLKKKSRWSRKEEAYGRGAVQIWAELPQEVYEADFIHSTASDRTTNSSPRIGSSSSTMSHPVTVSKVLTQALSYELKFRLAVLLYRTDQAAPRCFTIDLSKRFHKFHYGRKENRRQSPNHITIDDNDSNNLRIGRFEAKASIGNRCYPGIPLSTEVLEDSEIHGIDCLELGFEDSSIVRALQYTMQDLATKYQVLL